MSCTTNTLTQLGSDALNEAAGALNASNWVSPIEVGHAIVLNGTSAYGNGSPGGEAKWIGATVPQDQYAEIQWEYSGVNAEYVDLYLRRDPTNASAYWFFSWTHGSTSAYIIDNSGTFSDNYNLSSALATGNKLRVSVLGTQACVFRDTGSGYVLEHSTTFPAILPTGGSVAGQSGFGLSGGGLANNWATGSVTGSGPKTLTGTFQYPDGTPVANGRLFVQLSQDAQIAGGGGQVSGGVPIVIRLDASGSIPSNTTIWGSDQFVASTPYKVSVVGPGGDLLYGAESFTIAGASPIDISGLTPATPQNAGRP